MSLFSRNDDLPGLHAIARDCSPAAKGWRQLNEGEIAVIDAPNISRNLAQELINMKPAAVVNAARFATGDVPKFGPQMLLDADITLVENNGPEIWEKLKNGKKARLDGAKLYYGERVIASGELVDAAGAEATFGESQTALVERMEAFFGNTIEFIHSESPLFIDGIGVPELGRIFEDEKVIVVSPTAGHVEKLRELRNFIREFEPAIIAVDEAADSVVELGYKPACIVGNPANIGNDALRSGARVVLPADPDGTAVGLERIQDLGIGAITFPAATESSTDLALLLAYFHDAELVVSVGDATNLDAIFAAHEQATPSALLTQAKLGDKLVDSTAIVKLYTIRSRESLGWLWAILGILVAVAAIILIAGFGGDESFGQNLIDTWNNLALSVQDWFRNE